MYELKDFSYLKGLEGFSDELLETHFALYQGYVDNLNKLLEKIAKKEDGPEKSEMRRRLGWEFNGMRLHEYYFGALNKDSREIKEKRELFKKIEKNFGSFEKWEEDFRSTGMMRGIGWVILYYDEKADRLINFWINEHDAGHPAGLQPILVMDVFEHAYMIDYATRKADYINAFFKAVDWRVVEKRIG